MEAIFKKQDIINILEKYYQKKEGVEVKVEIEPYIEYTGIYEDEHPQIRITLIKNLKIGENIETKTNIDRQEFKNVFSEILDKEGFVLKSILFDAWIQNEKANFNGIKIEMNKKEEEKMNMKIKNLKVYKGMLIIVDMVNGFVNKGALHDEKIGNVVPRQIELIKEAKMDGKLIVFIKDTHDEKSVEHKRFGGAFHCVRGTGEEELIDELKPFENDEDTISIEKNSTSFMEAPKFRELIKELENLKQVDVAGCCTDICDFNGSMGLANYFDEWNKDVDIKVHTDAVATYLEEERQNYVEAAYLLMEQQGIQLVKKR